MTMEKKIVNVVWKMFDNLIRILLLLNGSPEKEFPRLLDVWVIEFSNIQKCNSEINLRFDIENSIILVLVNKDEYSHLYDEQHLQENAVKSFGSNLRAIALDLHWTVEWNEHKSINKSLYSNFFFYFSASKR